MRLIILCLTLVGVALVGQSVHATPAAASNTDAAHACQQGGYLTLKGSDGTLFKNEGQCVSYAAHGGTIIGINVCIVTSTTGCLTFNGVTLPAGTGTGNSITLTGSFSFVDTCTSGSCYFGALQMGPNDQATGGGTYTETNSSGAVISSGIFRAANTAGSAEGLQYLLYQDSSGALVSSCSAATGMRQVVLAATLIDSTTGATGLTEIQAYTGSLFPPPFVEVDASDDAFWGPVPSTTIAC